MSAVYCVLCVRCALRAVCWVLRIVRCVFLRYRQSALD